MQLHGQLSIMEPAIYHSFHDVDVFEPELASTHANSSSSPPSLSSSLPLKDALTSTTTFSSSKPQNQDNSLKDRIIESQRSSKDSLPSGSPMKRQDSGYASNTTTPRVSGSYSRHSVSGAPPSSVLRRVSPSHTFPLQQQQTSSQQPRLRSRPPIRRSTTTKSYHNPGNTSSFHGLNSTPIIQNHPTPSISSSPQNHHHRHSASFFHFPSPDPIEIPIDLPPSQSTPSPPTPPPQTTHYWTSDRTRRLEYAAIDAASRGFKGWIRRNLVPNCFKEEDRHLEFDDDSGSVRRYRLELEDEPQYDDKSVRRRKIWRFWGSRRGEEL